ncbi:checkpoint protein HUS1-like [Ornithodoros turicata]|uniref:checkpoint protein HUS1-like n=1 Tax=Ornithodoros turicata TaxID=34597 RepID=UPI003139C936
MKFRARIVDVACIQQFVKVVTTIAKLAKVVAIRFTLDGVFFIVNDDVVGGGGGVWAEVPQESIFQEFNMVGVSEEFNEIYLEVVINNLASVLKSTDQAKAVKMKLTKKQTPCLTFEIELAPLTANARTVMHDVPVRVIPRRMWANYVEPSVGDFSIEVILPSLRVLKHIVDKMKNLSTCAVMSVSRHGEMTLSAEGDLVTVTTHFKDLQVPSVGDTGTANVDSFEARVDLRRFTTLLNGQNLNPSQVTCKITHQKLSHFLFCHDSGTLQYFLPCVYS